MDALHLIVATNTLHLQLCEKEVQYKVERSLFLPKNLHPHLSY